MLTTMLICNGTNSQTTRDTSGRTRRDPMQLDAERVGESRAFDGIAGERVSEAGGGGAAAAAVGRRRRDVVTRQSPVTDRVVRQDRSQRGGRRVGQFVRSGGGRRAGCLWCGHRRCRRRRLLLLL